MIDDLRDFENVDRVTRTFEDGLAALEHEGPWGLLLLDNDLNDPRYERSGSKILDWLEEHPEYLPENITPVTANPVALQYMRVVIKKLYGS